MEKEMINFIKKIYFKRECCTKGEEHGAKIIYQQCEEIGVSPKLEEYSLSKFKKVKSMVDCGELGLRIKAEIGNGSLATSLDGVEKEFVYISCFEEACMRDLEDKICLVAARAVNEEFYHKLLEKRVAGLILAQGSIYEKDTQLDPHMFFLNKFRHAFPVVFISMRDANKLAIANPKKIKIVNVQEEYEGKGNHIVVDIQGSAIGEEMIVFSAHYDTTKYSKGAYDNGAGCAILMELIKHFKHNPPKMNLRFIFFGGEETGMIGSEYYCDRHKEEMNKIKLCINVDMVGVALGVECVYVISNQDLLDRVKEECQKTGFFAQVLDSIYSSDSISFSKYGVPSISFVKRAVAGGGAIHCKKDCLEILSPAVLKEELNFIKTFADLVANKKFKFKSTLSDKMMEEVKKY